MTYATVMVSLALDQPNEARLQVAGELAERFEADIVGVAAAQFAPVLILGLFGGAIADAMPKRRTLIITQGSSAVLSFLMAILVITGLQFLAARKLVFYQ